MAEIERAVMKHQCLRKHRVGNEFTLGAELIAWKKPHNNAHVEIR
jgi:hypothetical protein